MSTPKEIRFTKHFGNVLHTVMESGTGDMVELGTIRESNFPPEVWKQLRGKAEALAAEKGLAVEDAFTAILCAGAMAQREEDGLN